MIGRFLILAIFFLDISLLGCGGEKGGSDLRYDGQKGGSEGVIKVASINLLHDFPYYTRIEDRLHIVAQAIKKRGIDIVGIQEGSITPSFGNSVENLSLELGYYYIYARASGSFDLIGFEEGPAILSRYPIIMREDHDLRPIPNVFENRVVIRGVVETPRGPLNIYSTHLSGDPEEVNRLQADDLAEFIRERLSDSPAVLMGDFNATPESTTISQLKRFSFIDVYEKSHPDLSGFTCCLCIMEDYFNLFDPCDGFLKERIDYIFLMPGKEFSGEVLDSNVFLNLPEMVDGIKLWASDHIGVEGTLRLFP